MKVGVSLLAVPLPDVVAVTQAAEAAGYDSVWLSDHLILPTKPAAGVGGHKEVPPDLPLYDISTVMGQLAALTTRIRIGTWVYVLPVRHPIITARAMRTASEVSHGRIDLGIGVGYVADEFAAADVEFSSRGRRADEALEVCRLLWTEESVSYSGEFFDLAEVTLGPAVNPHRAPTLHIGGESPAALRRAARFGDGWIGMEHTPETLPPVLAALRRAVEAVERPPVEVTVGAGNITGRPDLPKPDAAMVEAFHELDVDRIIVRPWGRASRAIERLEAFADVIGLGGR